MSLGHRETLSVVENSIPRSCLVRTLRGPSAVTLSDSETGERRRSGQSRQVTQGFRSTQVFPVEVKVWGKELEMRGRELPVPDTVRSTPYPLSSP